MPRLETVNVPSARSSGAIDRVRTRSINRARLGSDLEDRLLVGVEDGRHEEGVVGRDGDADVDPPEVQDACRPGRSR